MKFTRATLTDLADIVEIAMWDLTLTGRLMKLVQ